MGISTDTVYRSVEGLELSEYLELGRLEAERVASDLLRGGEDPIRLTVSICPGCVDDGKHDDMKLPGLILRKGGEVWLRKECPEHGTYEDVYWSDYDMYDASAGFEDDGIELINPKIRAEIDCPSSCGLCAEHTSHTGLGNIVVTNRCDLNCYYCFFYAKEGEPIYEPSQDQIRRMMRALRETKPVGANCLQITGGEPAIREDIVDIVEMAKDEGFDHVQFNTDGVRFSQDINLIRDLRAAGVNVTYLSFDGLTPSTNVKNYHEVPDAIENLRTVDLGTVLVPTVIGGRNDDELGDIVRFAAGNMDIVRGVNFQPVSLVGRMSKKKRMEQRITIPEVCEKLEQQTDGALSKDDFYPVPIVTKITDFIEELQGADTDRDASTYRLSIHFACGVGTYVFKDENGNLVPINDFIDVEGFFHYLDKLAEEIRRSRFKRIRKTASLAKLLLKLRTLVDEDKQPEGVDIMSAIYQALKNGDYDGLRDFHHQSLFIGMMHFMDPYNYDVDRIHKCDIHYAVPDGRVIPFCAFNVLPELYRDQIQEEYAIPFEEWERRTGRTIEMDKHCREYTEADERRAEEFYAPYRRNQ